MIRTIKEHLIRPERRAVGFVFLAISASFGAWVTRLPELKAKLAITEGELGLALFFMPLGAVAITPFIGAIARKIGERGATVLGIYTFMPILILTFFVGDLYGLMAVLFGVGLAMALTDVAMNAVAAEVEKQFDCKIMSASHGFFSLGGMLGGATSGLFIWAEVAPYLHLSFWAVLMGVLVFFTRSKLVNALEREEGGKAFQLPHKSMLGMALICFCIFMSEGGITDWSTIYLREQLKSLPETAGLGFAGFSATMAIGRFLGDKLLLKHGAKKLLLLGCTLAVAGLGLTVLQDEVLAIAGFSLSGFGYSIIVPIVFSVAANTKGVPPAQAIASVASAGYVGLLVGPVSIGFIAEWSSLSSGFLFLIGLTFTALLIVLFRRW